MKYDHLPYQFDDQLDEISVRLQFRNYSDGLDVSSILGIEASTIERKGEIDSKTNQANSENYWAYQLTRIKNKPAEECIEMLLEQLRPKESGVKLIAEQSDAMLVIIGDYNWFHQGFFVSQSLARKLTDMNVALNYEAYCFEQTYLETEEHKKYFASVLNRSGAAEIEGLDEDELRSFISVLQVFEKIKPDIPGQFFPFSWDDDETVNKENMREQLQDVRRKLQHLSKAIESSRYLSDQRN